MASAVIRLTASDAEHVRVNVNFPLNRAAGTEGGAVVYFEIEPGHRLGRHTDSPEEILYIVTGTARPRSATSAAS